MGAVTRTDKTRKAFLDAFRRTMIVRAAAAAVGIDPKTHYRWLKKYSAYQAEFEEACLQEVAGGIEDEIKRRALVGVDEPIFHGGKRAMDFARDAAGDLIKGPDGKFVAVPAVRRVYSDACILALAEARVPGFSRRSVDHRFVDGKGRDRRLDVASVRAYMQADPDDTAADDA